MVKADTIESLKRENEVLKKVNAYYKREIDRLHIELIKRTRKVRLISLEDILPKRSTSNAKNKGKR